MKFAGEPLAPSHAPRAARSVLCAGAGLALVLAAGLAQARSLNDMAPQPAKPAAPKPPPTPDGLSGGGFYLEADTLTENQDTHHVIAAGSVEARYKGRVLRADRVDYDTRTQVVEASGAVRIVEPDGTAQFSDHIRLDKDLSEGFAEGFSARLQGHVQIAARRVRREDSNLTIFDHVVYTPCEVCAETGRANPTWSIRAREITENRKSQTLLFRDATIQVLGQNLFYIPVLQAADPSAERKSGFLLPIATFSGPRGVSFELPYYWAIQTNQDLLITPEINSAVRPFLNLDWRRRFYSGAVEIRTGYTYDKDFTSQSQRFGDATSRSYILANGQFQIDRAWAWGFTAERASDKLIFDKYSVSEPFVERGLYAADDRRLISQLYATRQDADSYLSIAAISVQGLRSTDQQRTFPTIAPLIEARWQAPGSVLGGRLRLDGSAVVLDRNQTVITTSTTTVLPGEDSRRATIGGDWRAVFTFANGLRVAPFLWGRGDLYDVINVPGGSNHATLSRGFGTVGADISYPLIRRDPAVTWILEPLAQIAVSPNVRNDPRIPNEDSVDFEFDETNLFSPNRSAGYDIYEGGQAVTLGGRATAVLDEGRSVSVMAGRRLAARSDTVAPAGTGLDSALSDWIFAADASPMAGVRIFTRLRMDSDSFRVNRAEAGASFTTSRIEGYVSYLKERQSPSFGPVESLDIGGAAFPLKHWGVSTRITIDGGAWRRRDLGLVYRDDCLRLEVLYRHDETVNGTLGPTTSVVLRLSLATLGNSR